MKKALLGLVLLSVLFIIALAVFMRNSDSSNTEPTATATPQIPVTPRSQNGVVTKTVPELISEVLQNKIQRGDVVQFSGVATGKISWANSGRDIFFGPPVDGYYIVVSVSLLEDGAWDIINIQKGEQVIIRGRYSGIFYGEESEVNISSPKLIEKE